MTWDNIINKLPLDSLIAGPSIQATVYNAIEINGEHVLAEGQPIPVTGIIQLWYTPLQLSVVGALEALSVDGVVFLRVETLDELAQGKFWSYRQTAQLHVHLLDANKVITHLSYYSFGGTHLTQDRVRQLTQSARALRSKVLTINTDVTAVRTDLTAINTVVQGNAVRLGSAESAITQLQSAPPPVDSINGLVAGTPQFGDVISWGTTGAVWTAFSGGTLIPPVVTLFTDDVSTHFLYRFNETTGIVAADAKGRANLSLEGSDTNHLHWNSIVSSPFGNGRNFSIFMGTVAVDAPMGQTFLQINDVPDNMVMNSVTKT